ILPPENGLLQLLEGKLYMARGKWHEASVAFDRANTQFQSTNPEAALLSAQSRIAIGELGAAIGRLRTVIDLRPDFMPARYELAQVHLKLRQFARAQQQADEILARNPHDLRAHLLQAA